MDVEFPSTHHSRITVMVVMMANIMMSPPTTDGMIMANKRAVVSTPRSTVGDSVGVPDVMDPSTTCEEIVESVWAVCSVAVHVHEMDESRIQGRS